MISFLRFRHFWAVMRNPIFQDVDYSFIHFFLWICQYVLVNTYGGEAWLWAISYLMLVIRVTELYTMALRGSLCVSWPFVINKDILMVYSLMTWIFVTFLMSAFNKSHLSLILYLSIALRIKFILLWKWAYLYFKHRHNILLSTSSFFFNFKELSLFPAE